MDLMRIVDAHCLTCADVQRHVLMDAGSCRCESCGAIQQMVSPVASPDLVQV
ncbi:MAG: hypothetical protein ACPHID_07080 [Thermoplasmatota archaeon]